MRNRKKSNAVYQPEMVDQTVVHVQTVIHDDS